MVVSLDGFWRKIVAIILSLRTDAVKFLERFLEKGVDKGGKMVYSK